MPEQASGASPDPDEQIDVLYPDGRRGSMTLQAWHDRDPTLGIRRAPEGEEAEPGDIVNEVTPTNEPDE